MAVGDESVRRANEERFKQACERRWGGRAGGWRQGEGQTVLGVGDGGWVVEPSHRGEIICTPGLALPTKVLSCPAMLCPRHRRFAQVKEKKLANAALACEKMINEASLRLSQVRWGAFTVMSDGAWLAGWACGHHLLCP